MTSPATLNRPTARWQLWIAFLCAGALHLAAVGFAASSNRVSTTDAAPPGDIDLILLPEPATEAPLEQVTADPLPPTQNEFPELNAAIEAVHRRVNTLVRTSASPASVRGGQPLNYSAGKIFALYAPRPDYPYEARRLHTIGSGIAILTVNPTTGSVTQVQMTQNTGSRILDLSALSAFRRWRFKTGTVQQVRVPITFTLNGVSY